MILKSYGTELLATSLILQNDINALKSFRPLSENSNKIIFPQSFDGSQIWSDLFIPIYVQSSCVSCWAFASVFTLSSRLAIYTNGKYKIPFSVSSLLFSDKLYWKDVKDKLTRGETVNQYNPKIKTDINKCRVDHLLYAWQHLYRYGVVEEKCLPDQPRINRHEKRHL